MSGQVRVDRAGPVARVVLDNPSRRNAITRAMWDEVASAFRDLAADSSLRAVTLRGALEGRAFSPGADVSEFPELRGTTEKALAYKEQTHAAIEAVYHCPVPVLALVDGPCVGGGCELAMAADLRLATEGSSFSLPVARLSNTADLGDIQRLLHAVGPSLAAEMLLSAGTLSAARAYAGGALCWTGPAVGLEPAAEELLARIVGAAPRAIRLAKQGLRAMLRPWEADPAAYQAGVRAVLTGADFAEGTRAFIERRAPAFTGG